MPEKPDVATEVQVRIQYEGADELTVAWANTFIVQPHGGELVMGVAQILPPFLQGTPDEVRVAAQALSHVTARVIGRYSMTPSNARELAELLKRQADIADGGATTTGDSA